MLISVCIPTYSRLDYLKQAVNSVLNQTFKEFEICVSLDPKPDGPDADIHLWCISMCKAHESFKYNVNEENMGLSGNWNVVVNMAKGDYLIIIGDDDLLEPGYLEEVSKGAIDFNADVVFTNQKFIDSDGKFLDQFTSEMDIKYQRQSLISQILPQAIKAVLENTVPMSSSIIRRSLLLAFPFDPILNTPELEVFLKIALKGGVFYYINDRLGSYRVHHGAATSSGLRVHYFVNNLMAIKVPAEYEPAKSKLISSCIVTGVNICLRIGDTKLAKVFLTSKYYPPEKRHYKVLQTIMLYSPSFINKFILS